MSETPRSSSQSDLEYEDILEWDSLSLSPRERNLLSRRKLILLLDLDEALTNTCRGWLPLKSGVHFWRVDGKAVTTRIRPGCCWFLKTMQKLYDIFVVTGAVHEYAVKMRRLLNGPSKLIEREVFAREGGGLKWQFQNIKRAFESGDSFMIKVDDDMDAWDCCPNIFSIPAYEPFFNQQSLSQLLQETREEDLEAQEELFQNLFDYWSPRSPDWSEIEFRAWTLPRSSTAYTKKTLLQQSDASGGEDRKWTKDPLSDEKDVSVELGHEKDVSEAFDDKKDVFAALEGEGDVSAGLEDKKDVSVGHGNEEDLFVGRGGEENVSAEHDAEKDVSAEHAATEDISAARGDENDVSAGLDGKGDVSREYAAKEDVSAALGDKEDASAGFGDEKAEAFLDAETPSASSLLPGPPLEEAEPHTPGRQASSGEGLQERCPPSPAAAPAMVHPTLWGQDNDVYLSVLAIILHRLHAIFYKVYDDRRFGVPDMNILAFHIKSQVLKGVVVHVKAPEDFRMSVMQMARLLGAELTSTIVAGRTTHCVLLREDSEAHTPLYLGRVARRCRVLVVTVAWLQQCFACVMRVPEVPFLVTWPPLWSANTYCM